MSNLAMLGGKPKVSGPIERFNTIDKLEACAAYDAVLGGPLSGFLGGELRGGWWVQELETAWAKKVGSKHAIATNSATSGLLAACAAIEPTTVITTPYTMSATAAAPALLGAKIVFGDVCPETFCLNTLPQRPYNGEAIIATNLFGHPAHLHAMRKIADEKGSYLIEDNAQAPFAMEGSKYAGTIGHIGVFSLNIHKHIQCGEGGVVVTDDDTLATKIRQFINHGEMAGGSLGLNLRMTEVTAAIALAQLERADEIIAGRVAQAEAITEVVRGIEWIKPPVIREGCKSVFYVWAGLFDSKILGIDRATFVRAMAAEGVPLVEGYVNPLYRLPAFAKYARSCPVAEELHDKTLFYFENCGHSPTTEQIYQFGEAFKKIERHVDDLRGMA